MHRLSRTLLKGPLQLRAADIHDQLIERGETPMSELIDASELSGTVVRKAVQWLRENNHVHIGRYRGEVPEMVLKAGAGIDAPRPKREPGSGVKPAPGPFVIPPPDPVLAAFFGLPSAA